MAERRTLICDICGIERPWSEANTWFGAFLQLGSERKLELFSLSVPFLEVKPFTTESRRLQHLCGAACVTRKVSEFLGQGVKPSEPPGQGASVQ